MLRLRFGINSERELTFEEIAQRVGLSRERVRQIERQAIARLRRRRQQLGITPIAA